MPNYQNGDENSYFPVVIAALIVIAVAIASFVMSFLFGTDDLLESILIGDSKGVVTVNPGTSGVFPTSEPNVIPPDTPPNYE